MGFFSDLKEDLSQAVNEMLPEGEAVQEEQPAEELELDMAQLDELLAKEVQESVADTEETSEQEQLDELASMLDKLELEQAETTEPEVEEIPIEVVVEEAVSKPVKEEVKNKGEHRAMGTFDENETATDEKAVITEGMTIVGDVSSKGSLEVLGEINGNIDILGKLDVTGVINGNSKAAEIYAESAKIVGEVNSRGSLKIGQSSVIIGDVIASSAVIAGAIKGDIDVKGPVILDTSAIVMGNIKSKSVQINNGAVVEGIVSQCYADVNPSAFFDEFKKTVKAK